MYYDAFGIKKDLPAYIFSTESPITAYQSEAVSFIPMPLNYHFLFPNTYDFKPKEPIAQTQSPIPVIALATSFLFLMLPA